MNERTPFASSVSFYFAIFMLTIYLLIAAVITFFQWPADLPKSNRIILASVIMLYVLYRGVKLVKKRRNELKQSDAS